MTIGDWIDRRTPRPPAPLMASLTTALGPAVNEDARGAAAVFLSTAEQMLRDLVAGGDTSRATADTLLTIDALTTYSLESAAEATPSLSAFADEAMTRFASVAAWDDRSLAKGA